ncbi:hypothetical protein B0H10DRAFT_2240500 [Mycena sp. CBHHK59/15]|nr:hypothetical protein B0H10DRAFT_2240500 [Mycena sp. CBHHK59/15]
MDYRPPSPEIPPLPPTPPPPQVTAAGRPVRTKRKTWKLLQQLPEPPLSVPVPPPEEPVPDPPTEPISTWVWQGIHTTVNSFGLFREYPSVPTYNPDEPLSINDLSDIPEPLPDVFHDYFQKLTGTAPSSDLLTHCRRELMHAIWRLILDDEFLHAYEHGIVIECEDGILRRFYPRIFTYSADYPEKILLATVRNLGKTPCPRCFLPKEQIPELGTVLDDKRREKLARTDNAIRRGMVERNAFSDRLSKFNFNPFIMLVPDFMHEFELGVFKSLFVHLLRILVAHGGNAVSELDRRFRLIPTFGQSTIRRFTTNTSSLKKLAAWNYQSILLCSIPVIDGLLPEPYNSEILDLLFTFAEWHSLAKLKLHTDSSVKLLGSATKEIGRLLRRFQRVVCPDFSTKELPSEAAARGRRQAKKATEKRGNGKGKAPAAAGKTSANTKVLSLLTYKLHSLGDYVRSILWFGTSDSYSTQPGELEHRRVKRFYARTNKNRAVRQMTQLERRESSLLRIRARAAFNARRFGKTTPTPDAQGHKRKLRKQKLYVPFAESEALPYTAPEEHHHISTSRNFSHHVASWLNEQGDDPATHDFLPKLKDHLLGRLMHPEWSGDGDEFTSEERSKVLLRNDRIYYHKILRVNYTTYDMRRGQDSLNPRTHSDIMMLAPEGDTSHPFSYAQVVGVFHADVVHSVPGASTVPQRMEFLWVRRYRLDCTWRGGFKRKRLHRLEFLPGTDPLAFGFVNPDEVIRGAHIIPAFSSGTTTELLPADSIGRMSREGLNDDEDWRYYFLNFFVDRDMFMRHVGGGVGHYHVNIPAEEAESSRTQEDEANAEDIDLPSVAELLNIPMTPLLLPLTGKWCDEGDTANDLAPNRPPGAGEDEDDLDFGPEDGQGGMEDEVVEGYAPL